MASQDFPHLALRQVVRGEARLWGIGQSVIAQLGRVVKIVQTLSAQLGEMVRIGCSANTQLSKRGDLVWA